MAFSRLLAFISSIIIATGIIVVTVSWWQQPVEVPAISITTYHNVNNDSLPVFAQFIFTQTLKLQKPTLITNLAVPIFYPPNSKWLQVDLRQNQHLLQRWRLRPAQTNQTITTVLPLYPPISVQGQLELVFNGRHILYTDQDKAPRLFIEKKASAYPEGNYRVANNIKDGNIGLTIFCSVPRRLLFSTDIKSATILALKLSALLILATTLPYFMLNLGRTPKVKATI